MKTRNQADDSDESGTETTPAKALKWWYVSYQDESPDEWNMVPGIARRFYEPRGLKAPDKRVLKRS